MKNERFPEDWTRADMLWYNDQFECESCDNIYHIDEQVTDYYTGEQLCPECMKERIEAQEEKERIEEQAAEMEAMFNSPTDYEREQEMINEMQMDLSGDVNFEDMKIKKIR